MSSKVKCPICGSKASPHRRGEALYSFPNALRTLKLKGTMAHTSCLISLVRARTKACNAMPRLENTNPSNLLTKLKEHSK